MDLANGRGRHGRIVEVDEELLDGPSELLLDDLAGRCRIILGGSRLELLQLLGDLKRDEVGPSAQDLAELDEGGAQLLAGKAYALA